MSDRPETEQKARAPRPEELVGQWLRDGDYRIEAVLGQGGMGRVFLATHSALHIPFAIKQGRLDQPVPEPVSIALDRAVHHASFLQRAAEHTFTEQDVPLSGGASTDRFIREALLLARLDHPAIPALYDYFVEGGCWYLVMDYIPGPTLSAYMQENAPLPPLEALNYGIQLCDVLEYLHRQTPPVVFRDVKPPNIILSPDGRVMLVDFGIARYFKPGQLNDTMEFGSPGYAPPEQYQGGSQTDGRSDLYSLGVILHEMLSGSRPAGAGKSLESLHYLNPDLSSVLSGLVTVATRSEPMYRFQSAHTLYLALERAYSVEERRAYQESIAKAETAGAADWSSLHPLAAPVEEKTRLLASPSAYREQREQIREALQDAHAEREEQARAEAHLDFIDQSLTHRSSMGLSSPSLVAVNAAHAQTPQNENAYSDFADQENLPFAPRPSQAPRRVVRALIVLALIALLIGGSVRVIGLLSTPAASPQSTTRTPTSTPTINPTNTLAPQSQSSWQVLPSLPSPNADNTTLYVTIAGRSYIYMSGGFRGPKAAPLYDQGLYRYDIAAAHWETVDSAFPGMGNNAAALDEHGDLFFTAGYSPQSSSVNSLLYLYQPRTNTLQKIAPQIALGYGASMLADQHGHLYLTQGYMKAGDPRAPAGSNWYRYDIASGQWHILAQLPATLGNVILAPGGDGSILLLGGSADAGLGEPSQAIYRYDIASNSWSTVQENAPAALAGASSCMNGAQQLVIIGGYNSAHSSSLNRVWLLNLSTLRWQPLASIPGGGSLLGTASCDGNGHVYVTRGANNPAQPTPDFLELTIS
jgi:serine/threonine protein kinase